MRFVLLTSLIVVLSFACKTESDSKLRVSGTLKNNPETQTAYLEVVESDVPRTTYT